MCVLVRPTWQTVAGIELASAGNKGGQTTYFVPNAVGIAGSMARFIIYSDYLYTINAEDSESLHEPVSITL